MDILRFLYLVYGFIVLAIIATVGNFIAEIFSGLFDPKFWTFIGYYFLFCGIVIIIWLFSPVKATTKNNRRRGK